MLCNIYGTEDHFLTIKNNINYLKTTKDPLVFAISTREIVNIISKLR